jgi:hypothetical protein
MATQSPFAVVAQVGVFTNALQPLFQIPAGFGGATLIAADVSMYTAGTAQLYIVNGGGAGTTTTGGTATTPAGTAYVAKTPQAQVALTTSAAFFDEGEWVVLKENNVGSTVLLTQVSMWFMWGQ